MIWIHNSTATFPTSHPDSKPTVPTMAIFVQNVRMIDKKWATIWLIKYEHTIFILYPDFGKEKQELAGRGRKPPAESVTVRLVKVMDVRTGAKLLYFTISDSSIAAGLHMQRVD